MISLNNFIVAVLCWIQMFPEVIILHPIYVDIVQPEKQWAGSFEWVLFISSISTMHFLDF